MTMNDKISDELVENFSDFAKNIAFKGDKLRLEEILDKEIIVYRYRVGESKYNRQKEDSHYLKLQIKYDTKYRVVFTGSKVLLNQIKQYESHLPFRTKIIKSGNYYSFS